MALLTLLAGLTVRKAHLGLPAFATKYGGSALWAVMIYWLLVLSQPKVVPWRLAVSAGAVATLVELGKLIHTPALDMFRLTLAGQLLLGKYFASSDLLAYWLGILVITSVDRRFLWTSGDPVSQIHPSG